MGEFVRHEACPCGLSSDAVAVYREQNGEESKFCFRCWELIQKATDEGDYEEPMNLEEALKLPFGELPDRGIRSDVAERYGVRIEYDPKTGEPSRYLFPVTRNSQIVGFKARKLNPQSKRDKYEGIGNISNPDFFGRPLVGDSGKYVIVTEGEIDALSVYQMLSDRGRNYRVVSLPHGANTKDVRNNLEWLNSFEYVVLCFDQDDPGKQAADRVAELLTPGKTKIVQFSEKDANQMLQEGKTGEFWTALTNARTKTPDGIVSIQDMYDRLINRPAIECFEYPEDWSEINSKTYGIRLGELDTWTGGTSIGKSLILKTIMHNILQRTNHSVGAIYLEESAEETVEDLMTLQSGVRFKLPDIRSQYPPGSDFYNKVFQEVAGSNRVHLFDHFGSVSEDAKLLQRIRYMANGLGCKFIFLDHLTIVVSEFADEGDERAKIDSIMTKLKRLTQELNIWLGLAVHLRKAQGSGSSFEEGEVPTLDDLRGSGGIKQLSNSVFAVSRDLTHPDPRVRNQSHLHVLKCRFTGETGQADTLEFDPQTGGLQAVQEES